VDAGSGRVKGSTSGQIPESAFTTASQGIARELAKIICDDTILYVGQASGTLNIDATTGCADHERYSYNANLAAFTGPQDPFPIVNATSGDVENDTGARGYNESGTGTYTLDPCPEAQTGGCSSELHEAPGTLTGQVLFEREGTTVKASLYTFPWDESGSGCSGDRVDLLIGEGTFPSSMVGNETITVTLSRHEDNPRRYEGSGTLTLQRVR
jgi:hypothetical protein